MSWQEKFKDFKILSDWEKYENSKYPRRKLNEYRLVKINFTIYLEVKTQKPEITFLLDKENFHLLKNYTWTCVKDGNTYSIQNKKKHIHRLIHPDWKMIDHMNRDGCDNRECNLRETTSRENQLNRKLQKNNTSKYNGICYNKRKNAWRFRWYENNKRKVKNFRITKNRTSEQAKQLAIDFKLTHDELTGNRNRYPITYS
ncbi:13752_t:CDS:1 [Ambispora leptoticha]|uniref:3291_t:CDS:1 n=2 Tax=Glomeromycetes TaxID=214506 RepID=A0A9N9NUJ5_9GLOM|nr:13752_t:CDS:1 [Ambispora leptoticha]CAG8765430.1 3291_t:CDS:1 [Racocetra fulgida]